MKLVVAGKTSVGKTEILTKLGISNILFVDNLVKEVFYKRGHPVFEKVTSEFGMTIIEGDFINTKELSKFVSLDEKKLEKLSLIVIPFIHEYIKSLSGNWLVEMAIYINYEEHFLALFDKVVLIERNPILVENKFINEKGEPIQTIKDTPINADFLLINDGTIEEAKDKLHNFLLSVGFKYI